MKKIIYSLVIMIAAGSLFTSCVENTEPQGIRDLREAKADYLAALSKLREADAEKVKAEAALVQAKTATEQARAALVQAAAKAKEIENDFNAAENAIALDTLKAAAEVVLAQQEKALAEAEEALRAYLVKIEEQSKELTEDEQRIVGAYTTAYNNVIAEQDTVRQMEKALYEATYNNYGVNNVEAAKAEYEQDKALAEQSKAYWETVLAANQKLSDEQIADYDQWVKAYDALKDENEAFKYDKAQIVKDSALNEYENKAVLDSFYAAIQAKNEAITKATKSFKLEFTGDKALALPELNVKEGTNVVRNFADAVNDIKVSAGWIHVGQKGKIDTLGIKFGSADKKVAEAAVDTLNIIIDALKREQVVVDQLVKDTAGIAALVVDTKHVYDSIKTALEAGIANFGEIAKKQDDYEAAVKKAKDNQDKFEADTATLTAKIKEFEQIWNKRVGTVKGDDSTVIWNAFIAVMQARADVFPNDASTFTFAVPTYDAYGELTKVVKDTVEFQNLDISGIVKNTKGYSKYGCYVSGTGVDYYDNPFEIILNAAFGQTNFFKIDETITALAGHLYTKEKGGNYDTFIQTNSKYRFNSTGLLWWKDDKGSGEYVPKYVTDEAAKVPVAEGKITEAKQNFYKGIYCTFWGIKYEDLKAKLNENQTAFNTPATDSLKIVYTEKTFTEPTVLAKFEGETDFFTPAKDKAPAEINFGKVTLKASKALDVIEKQLGKNYLKPEGGFTLYAQYLATAQFASDAKNYKENTAALKELETVVATVKTAYDAAVAATKSGSALADSLITKFIGKPAKDVKATDYVVKGSQGVETFISKDGKGTFKLAGEQKELAEKWLADYAKAYSELEAQKAEIDVTISDNNKLAAIYKKYVKKLAKLDEYDGKTPDEILEEVKGYWYGKDEIVKWGIFEWTEHVTGVLEEIQSNIGAAAEAVKVAEGKLAKLEAGFDQKQVDIEAAEDALAKAKAALEQAELEFAVAEEAYKAVLAAHGITE